MASTGIRPQPTVFISYAHESDALRTSVKALADWLSNHGCMVLTDHAYRFRPPDVGWQAWMLDCIDKAETVLVVCTPKLKLRYEKNAPPAAPHLPPLASRPHCPARSLPAALALPLGHASARPAAPSPGRPLPGFADHWGLYEMHGNVWEWCRDGERTYNADAVTDPLGPMEAGGGRALRGGSWYSHAQGVRSAYRNAFVPGSRSISDGFRCARVQAP